MNSFVPVTLHTKHILPGLGFPEDCIIDGFKSTPMKPAYPGRVGSKSSNRSLVPIGKPKGQSPVVSSSFSVEFFEARINVYTEEDPVTVLRAVKQASAI